MRLRCGTTTAVLALLAAGCSADSGVETAAACRTEEVVDRSGREVEAEICGSRLVMPGDPGGDPVAPSPPADVDEFGTLLDPVAPPAIDDAGVLAVEELQRAATVSRSRCSTFGDWVETTDDLVAALDGVTAAAVTLAGLPAKNRDDFAFAVSRAVLLVDACGSTEGDPVDSAALADPVERVVSALDRMSAAVLDNTLARSRTTLWTTDELRALLLADRSRRAGAEPQVWGVGSSVGVAALDAPRLEALAGLPTVNTSVNGYFSEVLPGWLDELGADPSATLVWMVGPAELFAFCDDRQVGAARRAEQRIDMFAGVSWTGPSAARDALFSTGFPLSGPLFDELPLFYSDDLDYPIVSPSRAITTAVQIENYGPAVEAGDVCAQRIDPIGEIVTDRAAAGRVVVVMLPVHPDLLAAHPGGEAGMRSAMEDFLSATAAAGASTLDLSDDYGIGQLDDATHLNAQGRAAVTADVARFLAELD